MYYEDDLSAIESARGCTRCELYWDWLSGCPYYCAKWDIKLGKEEENKDE